MRRIIIAFLLGVILGNVRIVPPARPVPQVNHVDVISLCDSLGECDKLWHTEVARRFPDAVVICGHGGDNDAGEWCVRPDRFDPLASLLSGQAAYVSLPLIPVTKVIRDTKARFPGRQIVLVFCNPGHHRLTEEGVAYAGDSVWIRPDRSLTDRNNDYPGYTGNIFEFLSNP
jgi:hypothetical protein